MCQEPAEAGDFLRSSPDWALLRRTHHRLVDIVKPDHLMWAISLLEDVRSIRVRKGDHCVEMKGVLWHAAAAVYNGFQHGSLYQQCFVLGQTVSRYGWPLAMYGTHQITGREILDPKKAVNMILAYMDDSAQRGAYHSQLPGLAQVLNELADKKTQRMTDGHSLQYLSPLYIWVSMDHPVCNQRIQGLAYAEENCDMTCRLIAYLTVLDGVFPSENDARDKWIYDAFWKQDRTYKEILDELKRLSESNGWDPLESIQGVCNAAKTYADRHGLDHPPARRKRRTPLPETRS
jgi:hypothetical protein